MTIKAEVIADSIGPNGKRITTFLCEYPRFIHAEHVRHRAQSFSVASSRAIPAKKVMEQVNNDPAMPVLWPKHHKGMQGTEVFPNANHADDRICAEDCEQKWLKARDSAVAHTLQFNDMYNKLTDSYETLSKQLTNRLIEPWVTTRCVCTATEWDGFFMLRHPWHMGEHYVAHGDMCDTIEWDSEIDLEFAAEYNIQALAISMKKAMDESEPTGCNAGGWHLPFIEQADIEHAIESYERNVCAQPTTPWDLPDGRRLDPTILIKLSAARCAYTSYNHNNAGDIQKELNLADRLIKEHHMCYDDKTEILTDKGWKFWKDCDRTEKLAAVDYTTGDINFEEPTSWYEGDSKLDDLYHVVSQQVDLMVTKNHNMVVSHRSTCPDRKQRWSEFYLSPASEVEGKVRKYLKSGNLQGASGIDCPVSMELLGFFVGDGHAGRSCNEITFHLKRKRKVEFLKKIWPTIRERRHDSYAICDSHIASWLYDNCYTEDGQKKLPDDFLSMTSIQVEGLLEGLKNSDGSVKRNTWVYDSSSELLLDQIQALAHTHGVSCSMCGGGKDPNLYQSGFYGRLNFTDRITPEVGTSQSGRSNTTEETNVPYRGVVYCATVSTGALMVRRNKKVVVSGNSPFEHQAMAIDEDREKRCFRSWMTAGGKQHKLLDGLEMRIDNSFNMELWSRNFQGWVQARARLDGE
jgi:hypothetical protein